MSLNVIHFEKIICSNCRNKGEKIFEEDESIEKLKILDLISVYR